MAPMLATHRTRNIISETACPTLTSQPQNKQHFSTRCLSSNAPLKENRDLRTMRHHGSLSNDEETNQAAWEAARGALTGSVKWGLLAGIAGAAAYAFSPVYRGLTFQFKVYLQMSGMIMGGMIEADSRMRLYETRIRHHKRMTRDMEVWRRFEEDFESRGTPGVGGEGNVKGREIN